MATIPRKYLTTSKSGLANIEPKNGQVISVWDSDEVYYDAPDDGTPSGTPIRRKISGFRVVTELPASPMEDILYAYISSGNDPDLRIWNGSAWVVVGNVTPDTQVQTDTSSGKFYLTGTSDILDGVIGTLLKNANVYVDSGNLYVKNGDLYVQDGNNRGTVHGNLDGNATTATTATTALTANTATKAITDNAATPHNITSYLHSVDIDSVTDELVFTLGDDETEIAIQIPNTTYDVFDDVTDGLVPKSGDSAANKVLTGTGWVTKSNLSVGSATNATNATNDSAGNQIDSTYYADVDYVTGTGLTLTAADGVTSKTVVLPISDYSVFNTTTDGLVPKPSGAGETNMFLKGDGTWDAVPVPNYQGATAIADGTAGLVPPAQSGHTNDFLKGDATWGGVFDTTYPGLVPSPLVADATYSLRANGTWLQSSNEDTKDTAGSSQVDYTVSETDNFVGDGTTTDFTLTNTAVSITSVTVDNVQVTTGYTFNTSTNQIVFDVAPADTLAIVVVYSVHETEVLYLIGAKVQDGGVNSPITYSTNKLYLLENVLYLNDNEIIDTVSYQDLSNKTFGGNALGTAAFVNASDTVDLTVVTITEEFTGDGTTTDFIINVGNPNASTIQELVSVKLNGVTQTEGTDYTFTPAHGEDLDTVSFTTAPAAPYYDLLSTEPANWSTNYEDYFTKDGDNYLPVEGVIQYSTNIESDWDVIGDNIWEQVSVDVYTQVTEKPADWDTTWNTYFTRSILPPTFAADTYYEFKSSDIAITYMVSDPTYSTENVPTNNAVKTYTNGRIGTVQSDVSRRFANSAVAADYNATTADTFTGDGTTTTFTLTKLASGISSITVDGEAVTTGYTFDDTNNQVTFTTAPADTLAIVITYTTQYSVGDYVMYNDGNGAKLYRCNTAITTVETPFDPTHWDNILLSDITDYVLASGIVYSNTSSGLTATNIQTAVDEIATALTYSSTEKRVGKWIDGKDLYEQTVTLLNMTATTAQTVAHSISADTIFIAEGITEYTVTNDKFYGIISPYKSTAADEELCIKIDTTNISYVAGTALANAEAYITVRYTKPTT